MTPADVSVIIPTLNEQAAVSLAIESARAAGAQQIIVVDGGSDDETVERAMQARPSAVVRSLPGRGIQLNSGAAIAEQPYLLFLHADNRLGPQCLQQICELPAVTWGAFCQRIDSKRPLFRAIEFGNQLRVRLRGVPFGDQGIFVERSLFNQYGGFDEIPLMEDLVFSRRMRKVASPVLLKGPIRISPRRWVETGIVRQTIRNWSLQIAFTLGASPERLKQRY